jgi:hypothetical protein
MLEMSDLLPFAFSIVLLAILVISFRSRAIVFCQYLHTMTGIKLDPAEVKRVFEERGRNGVRELFLELIIKEDLQGGPLAIPEPPAASPPPPEGTPTTS